MNLVDTGLVILSAVETWVLPFAQGCGSNQSLRILVTLRIVRILRVVRFFRLIKTFEQLWLIVSGLVSALKTVFWVLLLQVLLIYMCAIFATTQISTPVYFSSVLQSMVSLWQIATLDNWADAVVRPIVKESPALILFFIPFLFVSTFGIFNVIVGIVVENTVQSAQRKSESAQREDEIEKQTALDALKKLLDMSDPDASDMIRKSDFMQLAQLPQVREKLKIINITNDEVKHIFETIIPGDTDGMKTSALVAALSHMSGSAFQKDLGQIGIVLTGLIERITLAENDVGLTFMDLETLVKEIEDFRKRTLYFVTGESYGQDVELFPKYCVDKHTSYSFHMLHFSCCLPY